MQLLEDVIHQFSRLPGIGRKSATRIAYHLLKSDVILSEALTAAIRRMKSQVRECSVCGTYTDSPLCEICSNPARTNGIICVVELPQDIAVVEASREFKGTYHVLKGALSPLDGVGPSDLNIASLVARVGKEKPGEVILATNPTVEGEATALYIHKILSNAGIKITRLAQGLPMGGDLEYADSVTVARSLRNRTSV